MIYLDNAATTCPDPAVLAAMAQCQGPATGNASAVHRAGVAAATAVEAARERIAAAIHAQPDEIVFTAGGTEANNLALKGAAFARRAQGNHIITTAIEHASVLETVRWLAGQGFAVTFLPVDGEGFVDPAALRRCLRPDTILVSVMHANNEIGTIEPIADIGRLCRERGVWFHTDACQSLTHAPLDVAAQAVDLATLNAHKIHGPRGVGALYVRTGVALEPLFHGGGQEHGLRSGTYNVEGIAGFGAALAAAWPQ
jgi:cysteine desulfurase